MVKNELIVVSVVVIGIVLLFAMPVAEEKKVHQAVVAGSWYPSNETALKEEVNTLLNLVNRMELGGRVRGLIVPHAGYSYSGQVAAAAFKQLDSKYGTVFLMGPSHYYPLEGITTLNATHFATPLGEIKVSEKAKIILKNAKEVPEAFEKEHSLEAELPFLQTQLTHFELVPILVGNTDSAQLEKIIDNQLGENDLVVVSADLSHYHNYSEALRLDSYSVGKIMSLDENVFDAEIDAPWAVSSLIIMAKAKDWKPILLTYANSGDVTGDKSSVVGYSAIAFVEALTEDEQQILVNISKDVLDLYLKRGTKLTLDESKMPKSLLEIKGCFVTLYEDGAMRGCIGHIEPQEPLYRCVIDNTINAAVNDNRFLPVTQNDLGKITREISVLTVPQKVPLIGENLKNMLTTSDGVVLKQGLNGATYLPQVWSELKDKELFLSTLCEKGGMNAACWTQNETEVYIYQDFVIREK